ncbi:MAG: GDSL-type esterase/lipase family protein [Sphingobacteriales bacterium]
MIKGIKTIIAFLLVCNAVSSQQTKPPFWDDILKFKQQDSASIPEKNQILFVGSSSFTKWTDVQSYFPSHKILNRGFGGSAFPDLIRYERDVIFPYHAKQIVIYCGENDIAGDSSITGKIVYERFLRLYWSIRKNLLMVPIIYISMKPSPSRWQMRDKLIEGNNLIEKFSKKNKRNVKFINIWSAMLGQDGKPIETLFIEDNLHMNKDGYTIWQKIIEPFLLK